MSLPYTVRRPRPADRLIRDGETSRVCGVLVAGFAASHKIARNGSRNIVALHMAGDVVGLQGLILSKVDCNVDMLTAGTVAWVDIEMLRNLASELQTLASAILHQIAVDGAIQRQWTLRYARGEARSRIAHLLCELGLRLENIGLGRRTEFELPITQETLSDAVGLTNIHVNRTLMALAADGLIKRSGRAVSIPDWDLLARLGEFRPGYLGLTGR